MRLQIEVAIDDRRRERTERAVFARLAAAPPRVALPEIRARSRFLIVVPVLAAAVIVALVVGREPPIEPLAPALVTTPPGGSSRFTIGDVVIDAGSDTRVWVSRFDEGGTTLTLLAGSVDCDVPKRGDRQPFRVIAGEVVVEVIGTRFTVIREGAHVRVDVTRGIVAVLARGQRDPVAAGERWTSDRRIAQVPVPSPEPTRTPEPAPVAAPPRVPPPPPRPSPQAAYLTAQRLEGVDPKAAATAFRTIANGRDRWAALALFGLAELHAATAPADALREITELERRFPTAGNVEDAVWLRVDILTALARRDAARTAAAEYLRRYPRGTYAKQAAKLARQP